MSLFVCSLNSGSNANCYYVGNEDEAVLVDAGLSCRETIKRMRRLNLHIDRVKAVFISHEHSDHIKGIEGIAAKLGLPVYITPGTLANSRLRVGTSLINHFTAYQPVQIGALSVTGFPKQHDAADPHSFIVSGSGATVGVFTDIGAPCHHVIDHFKECHAAFLEANYDEQMLENGRYPIYLKRRIHSDVGHLSNRQALELFLAHKSIRLSHVFLSHLSKDNNDPALAKALFSAHAGDVQVIVASRYNETEVYEIGAGLHAPLKAKTLLQPSLFD